MVVPPDAQLMPSGETNAVNVSSVRTNRTQYGAVMPVELVMLEAEPPVLAGSPANGVAWQQRATSTASVICCHFCEAVLLSHATLAPYASTIRKKKTMRLTWNRPNLEKRHFMSVDFWGN
jgi:hypothetical protein